MKAVVNNVEIIRQFDQVKSANRLLGATLECVDELNARMDGGEYALLTLSPRTDSYVEYYKVCGNKVIATYYLLSSRSFPLLAHRLEIIDGKLIAINNLTSYATRPYGRVELCRKDLLPTDDVFLNRTKELYTALSANTDGGYINLW